MILFYEVHRSWNNHFHSSNRKKQETYTWHNNSGTFVPFHTLPNIRTGWPQNVRFVFHSNKSVMIYSSVTLEKHIEKHVGLHVKCLSIFSNVVTLWMHHTWWSLHSNKTGLIVVFIIRHKNRIYMAPYRVEIQGQSKGWASQAAAWDTNP
jgi:hypothetical protein